MCPYHAMLAHFPIALWSIVALIVLLRFLSDGRLARTGDSTLTLILFLGAMSGALNIVVGLMVWPIEATISSPITRNHLMMASWSLPNWVLYLLLIGSVILLIVASQVRAQTRESNRI